MFLGTYCQNLQSKLESYERLEEFATPLASWESLSSRLLHSSVFINDAETCDRKKGTQPLLLNLGVLSSMLARQNVFSGVSSSVTSPASYYRALTGSLRD